MIGEKIAKCCLANDKRCREESMKVNIRIRQATPEDHQRIVEVMRQWWDGRDLSSGLLKIFFHHFQETCFVAENSDTLVGFLVGFFSQSKPEEAYIHFAGVAPEYRRQGVGRALYRRYYTVCQRHGKTVVTSCTSPVNLQSIAYHQRMGFTLVEGNGEVDGFPVFTDYLRPNDPKVLFRLEITD